jgi:hypothetical protein
VILVDIRLIVAIWDELYKSSGSNILYVPRYVRERFDNHTSLQYGLSWPKLNLGQGPLAPFLEPVGMSKPSAQILRTCHSILFLQ